jgi:large repetitive protein
LTPEATYSYRIRALNAFGYSDWVGPVSATAATLPSAPTGFTAVAGTGPLHVDLAWTDNATTETTYGVYRGTDGIHFTRIRSLAADTNTCTDTPVAPGVAYYYKVAATNDIGSTYSPIQTATTAALPVAPSGLTAVARTAPLRIEIAWSDNSTDETSFRLYRSLDGVTWQSYRTLATDAVSTVDTNVSVGKTYRYKVQAVKAGVGNSAFSNVGTAST